MARKTEKTPLSKKGWVSNFTLIGEAKVGDYTFNMDQHSDKSDWIYNRMSLGIDTGENHGTVFAELMGGYGSERGDKNVIYVHGKTDEGKDDFDDRYTIHWDDRFDEDILEDIGDLCFMTAGLEKNVKGKTVYKKFLSAYDMIEYIQANLKDGMVVNVRGQLKYQMYDGNIQCKKEINSIALSSATPDKYRATFTQTMLLDQDSCGRDSIDKDKSVLNIFAYVIEKFKEFNGHDLTEKGKIAGGQFVPMRKTFEYPIDLENKDLTQKIINKIFKVKKGTVTKITFEGEFIESGAAVTATLDDVPEDIKELIDMGMYTEEEALAKCSENGNKERRMVIKKPAIRMIEDKEGNKTAHIQKEEDIYKDEDLLLDCLYEDVDDDEVPFEEEDVETEKKDKKASKSKSKSSEAKDDEDEDSISGSEEYDWLNDLD